MSSTPDITVVIPVRNMAAELPDCLTALTRQSCASFEIVVVDNGSTDHSRDIAAQFPVRVVQESIPGAAAARNCGIEAAQAPLVAFTDADCAPSRNWLRGLLHEFSDPEVTVVAGGLTPVVRESSALATYSSLIGQYSAEATLSHARFPYAPTANVAVRKEVLRAAGMFDTAFMTYEGADLFYRIHRLGLLRHRVVNRAMVFYQTRADVRGFVRQNYRYGQGYGRFCHRYQEVFDPGALSFQACLDGWRHRVKAGFEKIGVTDFPFSKSTLKRLHFARQTAQFGGMLRWRLLGPLEHRL